MKLEPLPADTNDERHKKLHDWRIQVLDSIDEHNFFIVRLTIAIELALKGIALYKGYNIFKVDKEQKRLTKVDDMIKEFHNKKLKETLPLGFFIKSKNLEKLLEEESAKNYSETFKFFRNQRNEFVHFASNLYRINSSELLEHLKKLSKFFDTIVLPLKDETAKNAYAFGVGVSL